MLNERSLVALVVTSTVIVRLLLRSRSSVLVLLKKVAGGGHFIDVKSGVKLIIFGSEISSRHLQVVAQSFHRKITVEETSYVLNRFFDVFTCHTGKKQVFTGVYVNFKI